MIQFLKPILPSPERYRVHVQEIYANRWFSNNGQFVQRFERSLQKYLQTNREIVVVSNATSGLMLALKGLDIKGRVLVPSFTFAATIGAIQWCGLEYEYVDVDSHWCLDPEAVEQKLQTGEYGAIMPVHTFGLPCDVVAFEQLASKYSVKLVFDAAPAIGSMWGNQHIGSFGDIEVFSLHATKTLPVGEGGFLSIKDPEAAKRIRQLKNFGFNEERVSFLDGLNAKMPEILAAIGVEAIKDLEQHLHNRARYVAKYKALLNNFVEFQKERDNCRHGNQCLSVLVNEPDGVVDQMSKQGIQIRRYFSPPIHLHPAYHRDISLPRTMEVSNRIINLPLYSVMDNCTIEIVCDNLKRCL